MTLPVPPVVAGAAVSAAGKLLGGILGNRAARKNAERAYQAQKRMEENRFKWLVKGAKNAGFNPLTVLRSTGGAQASAPYAELAPLQIGEAVSTIGQGIQELPDAIEKATRQERLESLKMENARLRRMSGAAAGPPSADGEEGPPENWHLTRNPWVLWSPRFGNADPFSDDVRDMRVDKGPYKGQYVVCSGGACYALPKQTPTAMVEEILGGVLGEVYGVVELGSWIANELGYDSDGLEQVFVNDRGQVTGRRPKSRPPLDLSPPFEPEKLEDLRF